MSFTFGCLSDLYEIPNTIPNSQIHNPKSTPQSPIRNPKFNPQSPIPNPQLPIAPLRLKTQPGTKRTLVLYTANGCHLCEEAQQALARLRTAVQFTLDIVDIAGDPELERRYRSELPVLLLEGRKIARFRIDPDKVIRALAQ